MYTSIWVGGGGHVTIHIFKFICRRFAVINVYNTHYSKMQDIQCYTKYTCESVESGIQYSSLYTVRVKSVYIKFKSVKNKRKKSAKVKCGENPRTLLYFIHHSSILQTGP
jgi:hypothetical protein